MSAFWRRHSTEKLYKYHPRYYLGYGSNLNIEQMTKRCDTAKVVCSAELLGYKLVFSGVATVEPEPESTVPCGVWYVEPDDIEALDLYEGYPHLYEKYNCTITINGEEHPAFFYALDIAYDMEVPSSYYLDTVEQGYKDFSLDRTPLAEAVLEAHMAEQANDTLKRACCWCGESFPRLQMHNEGRGSYLCHECYNEMAYDLYGYKPQRDDKDDEGEHDYYGELITQQGVLFDDPDDDPWGRDFDPAELDWTPRSRYLNLS